MARETHTSTPWRLASEPTVNGTYFIHTGDGESCVAEAANQPWHGDARANAALIVAAVNERAALREALKWALGYGNFDVAVDNPMHAAALDRARAALALGEETKP